jgi:hypothetical protein
MHNETEDSDGATVISLEQFFTAVSSDLTYSNAVPNYQLFP